MEGQCADVDTEERVPTQYFDIPVVEVESLMWGCSRGVNRKFFIGSIFDRGVDGRLIIGGICNGEIGQSGDTDGRGMSGGSGGRRRNWARLWSGNRYWRRGLEDLRLGVSVRKSQGCGNGSCSGVFLVHANRLWLLGCEYRWRREALPTALP